MLDQRLLLLIADLADIEQRPRATQRLAQAIGAEDLIVFSADPLLKMLLPAPGFPKTLPDGLKWRQFIDATSMERVHEEVLTSPYTHQATRVVAVKASDGSAIAVLGGAPDLVSLVEVSTLVPLIVAAFAGEQNAAIARGELEAESLAAKKEQGLALALDASRRDLEAALHESRRSHRALRESQEWLETTLRSIGDAVIAIKTDRTVSFVNTVAEELTGWRREEAVGRPMEEVFRIVHELTREPAVNPVDRVIREGRVVGLANHTVLISRDGSEYVIEDSAAPIRAETGDIIGVVLVFRDTTAEHAQSRALANAHAELKVALADRDQSLQVLETIHDVGQRIMGELDLEKLVQHVTDAATRIAGAQFGAFFYKKRREDGEEYMLYSLSGAPREAFSKFPLPGATALFHPTFMGEGTIRSDDILQDPRYGKSDPHRGMPPGHLPVRSYLAVSVISRGGEVLGGLFFGHGEPGVFNARSEKIVEGLAAQAAIAMDNARLYEEARRAIAVRDDFLSIASHELKTPLTSLKLQTQLRARSLRNREPVDPERLAQTTAGDDRQIDRLTRLIDDMLDLSRISTGKLGLRPERFDLCDLVGTIIERYRPQFEAIESRVEFNECEPIFGNWDSFRIEQVVSNLLTNALRYGAGKPVDVTVSQKSESAMLRVRDRGIGILPAHQSRIFERFERAVSSEGISGLGLGLYIVREILKMHGGSIRVESVVGEGSTFIVELPLHRTI